MWYIFILINHAIYKFEFRSCKREVLWILNGRPNDIEITSLTHKFLSLKFTQSLTYLFNFSFSKISLPFGLPFGLYSISPCKMENKYRLNLNLNFIYWQIENFNWTQLELVEPMVLSLGSVSGIVQLVRLVKVRPGWWGR